MKIQMIGINYKQAEIQIREKFSFTASAKKSALNQIKSQDGVSGCVLLSTCNRTEVWISTEDDREWDMIGRICQIKQLEPEKFRACFEQKEGMAAVRHLFYLAGGLESQILGEDQILTQIGDALTFAREQCCTDSVLEVLFRMAVTSGKKVKTKAPIPSGNPSAPLAAIRHLEKHGYVFCGKKCLVIGNGVMGKITAELLLERGAGVTVTLRRYKKGTADMPKGAERIEYEKRYEVLPSCDYVFSATASPNITIRREALAQCVREKEMVLIDLAVPRDIDPALAAMPQTVLYNMDDFQVSGLSAAMRQAVEHAVQLSDQGAEEYRSWYENRKTIPQLLTVSGQAADDVLARIAGSLGECAKEKREYLEKRITDAVEKVTRKCLFGIRDSLDAETFRMCLSAIETVYENSGQQERQGDGIGRTE